jgi:hypothetical protein
VVGVNLDKPQLLTPQVVDVVALSDVPDYRTGLSRPVVPLVPLLGRAATDGGLNLSPASRVP